MSELAKDTTEDRVLNGVNVDGIFRAIALMSCDAGAAKFQFRNRNQWITGGLNRSFVDGFYGACNEHTRETPFVLDNDEPPVLLGEDRGANPVEQVLHGLAGCITTTLVYHAAARGIRIDEMETSFEGDLDLRGLLGIPGAKRNGYEEIRIKVRIRADDATKEEIDELVKLAERRSPVFDIVSNPVPVKVAVDF